MRNVWRSITLILAACALTGCFTAAPIGTLYAQDLNISVTRPAVQLGSLLPLTITGGVEPYTYEVSQGSMYGSEYVAPSTLHASLNESLVSIKVTGSKATELPIRALPQQRLFHLRSTEPTALGARFTCARTESFTGSSTIGRPETWSTSHEETPMAQQTLRGARMAGELHSGAPTFVRI